MNEHSEFYIISRLIKQGKTKTLAELFSSLILFQEDPPCLNRSQKPKIKLQSASQS